MPPYACRAGMTNSEQVERERKIGGVKKHRLVYCGWKEGSLVSATRAGLGDALTLPLAHDLAVYSYTAHACLLLLWAIFGAGGAAGGCATLRFSALSVGGGWASSGSGSEVLPIKSMTSA